MIDALYLKRLLDKHYNLIRLSDMSPKIIATSDIIA